MTGDHRDEQYMLLWRYRSMGDWQRMLETAIDLLSHDPDDPDLHENAGAALRQLSRFPESETHYKKAIQLDPDNDGLFNGMGWLYYQWGRMGTADDYTRQAINMAPDDPDHWLLLGYISLHHNDPQQAMRCAEKALSFDAENQQAHKLIATAKTCLDGPEKVSPYEQIRNFEKLLEQDPDDESLLYQIGSIHIDELNDPATAETYFRRCLAASPEDKDYQKGLITCLRKKELILRLLWLPLLPATKILKVFEWAWEHKWPLIFLIFVAKYLIVIAAFFFVLFAFVFWPITKAYEYLTIADLHKKMGRLAFYTGPMARLHKAPFIARMGLFLLVMLCFWSSIFMLIYNTRTSEPVTTFFFTMVAIVVILLVFGGWILTFYEAIRTRLRDRKNKDINSL